jgi:hypothetical protein
MPQDLSKLAELVIPILCLAFVVGWTVSYIRRGHRRG